MKVTFIGDPSDPRDNTYACEMFGMVFPRDQDVDVSGLPSAQQAKLRGNRHFRVSEDANEAKVETSEAPKRRRGRPPKQRDPEQLTDAELKAASDDGDIPSE